MNSDYCSACGGKVEYLLNKPNFCPHCGSKMGGATSRSSVTPKRPTSPQRPTAPQADVDDDPEGTDVSQVPYLQGLQYEIEGDFSGLGKNHGTLGAMMQSAEISDENVVAPKKKASKTKSKASNKKTPSSKKPFVMPDAIKKSMKECGSSAANPSDVG